MKLSKTTAQKSFEYSWLLSRIYPYIRPVMSRVILGFLVALPVGMLDGVVAFALKPYMDYVIGKHDLIFTLCGATFNIPYGLLAAVIPFGVVFFAIVQGVLRYLNSYLTDWTSQKITNSVKIALFSKLVYMDSSFFDINPSGIIISRYLNDPDTASKGLVDKLKTAVTSVFGAISLITVMLYSSWKLAIVGVVVLCIAFLPVALIRKKVKSTSNENMVVSGNITTNFNETYSGNKVMTAYCLQERQKHNFEEQIHKSFDITMSLTKRSGWMSPLMYFIASIGIAIVLFYGTNLIMIGEMTGGGFASFVTSLLLLYKPVKTLGNTLTSIQTIFVALGRVFELFDIEADISNKKDAVEMKDLNQSVKFNNVSFAYNEEKTVLHNLSLDVQKGETIAIVGNSGGGKSTLVNLLPRFYDVTEGAITIDGVDIRNISLDSLRKNIAMVFQDNFLFTGTIRENILMGNPNATEEELNQAVESAHLEEMIADLPNGLDTELGERGTTLSGGQRQRVAIARAMVKKSPIVVLDEATSALDNKSEAVVQKALDNLIKNKTVFVIAHRLSTIQNAHRIAVINEGHLVELGSHDELMQIDGGQYKMLYEMQFKHQAVGV
jgi:subfamily B ATP-binding cassette protein MsbA